MPTASYEAVSVVPEASLAVSGTLLASGTSGAARIPRLIKSSLQDGSLRAARRLAGLPPNLLRKSDGKALNWELALAKIV